MAQLKDLIVNGNSKLIGTASFTEKTIAPGYKIPGKTKEDIVTADGGTKAVSDLLPANYVLTDRYITGFTCAQQKEGHILEVTTTVSADGPSGTKYDAPGFTIPLTGKDATGLISSVAQDIYGTKTFKNKPQAEGYIVVNSEGKPVASNNLLTGDGSTILTTDLVPNGSSLFDIYVSGATFSQATLTLSYTHSGSGSSKPTDIEATMPPAESGKSGVVSATTQFFSGVKTFDKTLKIANGNASVSMSIDTNGVLTIATT